MKASVSVPVARDGSMFLPELRRSGVYVVGRKGEEQRFGVYEEALQYLEMQPVACWRRPNSQGNWGIVSAVQWISLNNLSEKPRKTKNRKTGKNRGQTTINSMKKEFSSCRVERDWQ